SMAIASSSTGRPWHALRTPALTLARLKGSVTPDRFTIARTASSTVVNRRPHSGQDRRRRINAPSSASRESTTRESGWRQYGQRMARRAYRTAECPSKPARHARNFVEQLFEFLDLAGYGCSRTGTAGTQIFEATVRARRLRWLPT